jgi:hypothetical protein
VNPLLNPWSSRIIFSVAVLLVSGCGDNDDVSASPTPSNTADVVETLPLVEWYPTPKHQHRPQYTMPSIAPSQDWQPQAASRPVQQQPVWGGGYVQSIPQPWVPPAAPIAGYGAGVPAQGTPYAPVPVWGQNVQPAQPYFQPAQPMQQQHYPQAPQYGYVQRPWGAIDGTENSNRAGQSMNTWQMTNELPAWGVPSSGTYPVQNPGFYSPRQGTVQPGYYW